MATISSLRVTLTAETKKFQQRINAARESIARFAKRTAIAAAAIGTALAAAFSRAVGDADRLNNLAIRLGTTTEALSELRHVAATSGIDFNIMSTALQRMVRRIDEVAATGKGTAAGALEELGLQAEALNRLTVDKRFEVIAEAMSKLGRQSERVRLAMAIFDTEGVQLVQTMTRGARGIREARMEARELGITITSDTADAAAKVSTEFTKLWETVKSVGRNFVLRFAPTIALALSATTDFVKKFATDSGGPLAGFFDGTMEAINIVGIAFERLASGDIKGAFGTISRLSGALIARVKRLGETLRNELSPETRTIFDGIAEAFRRGVRFMEAMIAAIGTALGAFAATIGALSEGNFVGAISTAAQAVPDAAARFDRVLAGANNVSDFFDLERSSEDQVRLLRSIDGKITGGAVAQ